ncbi:MAG TPA: OmpH family outer membrane protein [Candidatus Polarisedimenticolia bacterium]|jgi:outer membrane protein|nr:OmpH family outer membrane protein [Candidatus Polarisedimenticolia bacterium]
MTGKMIGTILLAIVPFAPAAAQQQEPRIGVFDSQPVWQQTEEGKKLQAQLAAFRDGKVGEINGKESELNKLRERLRSQEVSLSDDKKSQMLKDIDQKTIDLKRLNDDATREMQSQLKDAQDQFQRELFDVVEALGKDKKYTLILEKTIVVYNNETVDITKEVVAKFNEMFKGAAAAPPAAKTKEVKPTAEPKKPAPDSKKPPGGGN